MLAPSVHPSIRGLQRLAEEQATDGEQQQVSAEDMVGWLNKGLPRATVG